MKRSTAFITTFLMTRVDFNGENNQQLANRFLHQFLNNTNMMSLSTECLDVIMLEWLEGLSSKRLMSLIETTLNQDI